MILKDLGIHHKLTKEEKKYFEGKKPVVGLKSRLHPAIKLPYKLFILSSYNGTSSCFSTEWLSENQMHVPEVNKDKLHAVGTTSTNQTGKDISTQNKGRLNTASSILIDPSSNSSLSNLET